MSLGGKVFPVAAGGLGLAVALTVAVAQAVSTATTTPRPPAAATTPAPATRPPAAATTPAPAARPPAAPATPAPVTASPARPVATSPGTASATAAPEISAARLAIAREVVKNAPVLGNFDGILPDLMLDTETRLINQRPDLYKEIATIVQSTATSLVPRRNDLDNDIARAWARAFNDDELKAINAFFTSPAGAKYKMMAPQVGTDIIQAGQNWADRLAAEMYDLALAELKKQGKL